MTLFPKVNEIIGMMAIANALDRTLVLPCIVSHDFIGATHVLDFGEVFDVPALKHNLAG